MPEQRVYDAERNLLIQNLELSWRYSLGNPYERFSWELPDVAEVMGAYGYEGVERSILQASLHAPTVFPNRAAGEEMVGSADYFRRSGDVDYVDRITPRFRRILQSFVHQLDGGTRSLLRRERYGADILGPIYGLHAQALALQGLRAMADVWARTGYSGLATQATQAADRLDAGLRAAVAAAQVAMPDGSLFVPIALVDGTEHPYTSLTSSKRGSYWNLVMPYVLASGFLRPHSAQADGLLAYLLNHGSRLLGLVRFSPHTGVTNPGYQLPGTDDVYGTNVARFLADEDQPDQLVLSLYGKLAVGMTENTFVAGEGSTVLPTPNQYYRWMFRPPNSANNAFFLETLRLMLVHETTDAAGLPTGLELAYSTPRAWLAARPADRGAEAADELRAAVVLDRHGRRHRPRGDRLAERLRRDAAPPLAAARGRAPRRDDGERRGVPFVPRLGDARPQRQERPRRGRRASALTGRQGSRQNGPMSPALSRIAWFWSRVCGRQSGSSRSCHQARASSAT